MNDILIKTEKLVKTYPMGKHTLTALDHVDLQFIKGEFTGVVGPSGSGKTTLLNIIGSLDVPTSGSAVVLGQRVEHLSVRPPICATYTSVLFSRRSISCPSIRFLKMWSFRCCC
jgi:ABC-type lipoprotein export system ATPase subunit